MTTDTSEKGLEHLICTALTGAACDPPQGGMVREAAARLLDEADDQAPIAESGPLADVWTKTPTTPTTSGKSWQSKAR